MALAVGWPILQYSHDRGTSILNGLRRRLLFFRERRIGSFRFQFPLGWPTSSPIAVSSRVRERGISGFTITSVKS